jgi:Fur family ferric uptake transcriptional regulator
MLVIASKLHYKQRLSKFPQPDTMRKFATEFTTERVRMKPIMKSEIQSPKLSAQAGLSEAINLLKLSNYRFTQTRRTLLEEIFKKPGPFSAPSLERALSQPGKKSHVDPVTIYRTLPVLQKLGIIERCDFSDDVANFEVSIHHGPDHHHHHIVCNSCKKVEAVDFCIVEGQEQVFKKLGYTRLAHKLEFNGLCPRCSA